MQNMLQNIKYKIHMYIYIASLILVPTLKHISKRLDK